MIRILLIYIIVFWACVPIYGKAAREEVDSLQDTMAVQPVFSPAESVVDSSAAVSCRTFAKRLDRYSETRFCQITYVGFPLLISGMAVGREDTHFRRLRNDYMPRFRFHLDDYTQYAPGAVMLGLKAFGVKGRSSWARMLVSDAVAAALMASVVNTVKHNVSVLRPDGSNDHSFPSGHTATAFMTATMLTKEYGYKSPWVGIAAYATASSTGFMRMANNKHWLSDVLTGAGIGILSTELGYWVADLIFRDKGLVDEIPVDSFAREYRPSFVSLYVGHNVPLGHYHLSNELSFRTSSGSTAGLEGAYFFNRYIGVGGRFAASNTRLITNSTNAEDKSVDNVSLLCGPYVSCPISRRWFLGSKLIAGWAQFSTLHLKETTVPHRGVYCMGTGLSLMFRARARYGIRFFTDYGLMMPHSKLCKDWIHTLTMGGAFAVTW